MTNTLTRRKLWYHLVNVKADVVLIRSAEKMASFALQEMKVTPSLVALALMQRTQAIVFVRRVHLDAVFIRNSQQLDSHSYVYKKLHIT